MTNNTFVTESVTTTLQVGEEEQFSPFDTFKTRSEQDFVATRWETGEEEVKRVKYSSLYEKCSFFHQSAT